MMMNIITPPPPPPPSEDPVPGPSSSPSGSGRPPTNEASVSVLSWNARGLAKYKDSLMSHAEDTQHSPTFGLRGLVGSPYTFVMGSPPKRSRTTRAHGPLSGYAED